MTAPVLTLPIRRDADVVVARWHAGRLAGLLGFDFLGCTRIAAAVAEVAHEALIHGGGEAELGADAAAAPQWLVVRIVASGGGLADAGSTAGGLAGVRRLVDRLDVRPQPGGGTVDEFAAALPQPAARAADWQQRAAAAEPSDDPAAALHRQNREIIGAMAELGRRQEELSRLNRELEETNRGVVALYAELDEKAEQLRQVSEAKSRFLANMGHEFRTPLNSILALSRLLLGRVDGPLEPEQERQISYIRRSAEGLLELVNDLLDLAKVEAGKIDVKPVDFTVPELFASLRGVLKPLQTSAAVRLVFDDASGIAPLHTDEAKVAQILRNFISNALKFTAEGEVRVRADQDGALVVLAVHDTGIGIAAEDQTRIFEEFEQVESDLQRQARGTGLGLPLSRKLAGLLGGTVSVDSRLGEGSVFRLALPADLRRPAVPTERQIRVLVVDDDETFRYVMRQLLAGEGTFVVVEAADGREGLGRVRDDRPDVIVLDLQMPVLDGYGFLQALAADPAARQIPVVICTSSASAADDRQRLGRTAGLLPKEAVTRDAVLSALRQALRHGETV